MSPGIAGVGQYIGAFPGGSEGDFRLNTSGISGISSFPGDVWPDDAGSCGKGGISGDAGRGRSITSGVGLSCKVCCGSDGASGASGKGISGSSGSILNLSGPPGEAAKGGVVMIAARYGILTGGAAGWAGIGISTGVSMVGLAVAGFPVVFPLVMVPGGKGGGTFQSDKLCTCAAAVFNEMLKAISVTIKTSSSFIQPLILVVCMGRYVVAIKLSCHR